MSRDWEVIEREYRAGQLSIRAIARQYEVAESAIRKRAGLEQWARDLTNQVHETVRSKLVRSEVRTPSRASLRLTHIEQARTKYRKLAEESPNDRTLADKVRDLETDLALLIESRGYLVEERQEVRDQVRALAGSLQPQQSPAIQSVKSKLQAKIDDLIPTAPARARRTCSIRPTRRSLSWAKRSRPSSCAVTCTTRRCAGKSTRG